MPRSYVLQPTITVYGADSTTDRVFQRQGILDLGGGVDVDLWTRVYDQTGTNLRLYYQTSLSGDAETWSTMDSVILSSAGDPDITKVRFKDATIPLLRFVRWGLYGSSGTFNATFQTWVVVRQG
jgi:hypothetical protein